MKRAIEIALANPIDFEYAIDKEVRILCTTEFYPVYYVFTFDAFNVQGRIFHGRKTLCNLLDKSEVKKIPEPTAEEKFILQN